MWLRIAKPSLIFMSNLEQKAASDAPQKRMSVFAEHSSTQALQAPVIEIASRLSSASRLIKMGWYGSTPLTPPPLFPDQVHDNWCNSSMPQRVKTCFEHVDAWYEHPRRGVAARVVNFCSLTPVRPLDRTPSPPSRQPCDPLNEATIGDSLCPTLYPKYDDSSRLHGGVPPFSPFSMYIVPLSLSPKYMNFSFPTRLSSFSSYVCNDFVDSVISFVGNGVSWSLGTVYNFTYKLTKFSVKSVLKLSFPTVKRVAKLFIVPSFMFGVCVVFTSRRFRRPIVRYVKSLVNSIPVPAVPRGVSGPFNYVSTKVDDLYNAIVSIPSFFDPPIPFDPPPPDRGDFPPGLKPANVGDIDPIEDPTTKLHVNASVFRANVDLRSRWSGASECLSYLRSGDCISFFTVMHEDLLLVWGGARNSAQYVLRIPVFVPHGRGVSTFFQRQCLFDEVVVPRGLFDNVNSSCPRDLDFHNTMRVCYSQAQHYCKMNLRFADSMSLMVSVEATVFAVVCLNTYFRGRSKAYNDFAALTYEPSYFSRMFNFVLSYLHVPGRQVVKQRSNLSRWKKPDPPAKDDSDSDDGSPPNGDGPSSSGGGSVPPVEDRQPLPADPPHVTYAVPDLGEPIPGDSDTDVDESKHSSVELRDHPVYFLPVKGCFRQITERALRNYNGAFRRRALKMINCRRLDVEVLHVSAAKTTSYNIKAGDLLNGYTMHEAIRGLPPVKMCKVSIMNKLSSEPNVMEVTDPARLWNTLPLCEGSVIIVTEFGLAGGAGGRRPRREFGVPRPKVVRGVGLRLCDAANRKNPEFLTHLQAPFVPPTAVCHEPGSADPPMDPFPGPAPLGAPFSRKSVVDCEPRVLQGELDEMKVEDVKIGVVQPVIRFDLIDPNALLPVSTLHCRDLFRYHHYLGSSSLRGNGVRLELGYSKPMALPRVVVRSVCKPLPPDCKMHEKAAKVVAANYYLVGVGLTACLPSVYLNHPYNHKVALLNRHLRPDHPMSTILHWQRAHEIYIPQLLAEVDVNIVRPPLESWIASQPPIRHIALKKFSESHATNESPSEHIRSFFIKTEVGLPRPTGCDGRPRGVQALKNPASQACLGPFISSVMHALSKPFMDVDINSDVRTWPRFGYTCGASPSRIGQWYNDMRANGYSFVSTDYSEFDSTQRSGAYKNEFSTYSHFKPTRMEWFALRQQLFTKGKSKFYNYSCRTTRKSGDPNTAVGNKVNNDAAVAYMMYCCFIDDYKIIVLGDDLVIAYKSNMSNQALSKQLTEICALLGLVVKVSFEHTFCSSFFVPVIRKPVGDTYLLVPDVRRIICKLGFSADPLHKSQTMLTHARDTLMGLRSLSLVPVGRSLLKAYGVDTGSVDLDLRPWRVHCRYGEDCVPNEFTDVVYANCLNMSCAELYCLESVIYKAHTLSLGRPSLLSHPSVDLMVDRWLGVPQEHPPPVFHEEYAAGVGGPLKVGSYFSPSDASLL